MSPIKTVIHGAAGKVGQVLISSLAKAPEVKLVGAVDITAKADNLSLPDGSLIPFSTDLEKIINETKPEVIVDFTWHTPPCLLCVPPQNIRSIWSSAPQVLRRRKWPR
jgi:dihydrodipicolinate reductase